MGQKGFGALQFVEGQVGQEPRELGNGDAVFRKEIEETISDGGDGVYFGLPGKVAEKGADVELEAGDAWFDLNDVVAWNGGGGLLGTVGDFVQRHF